MTKIVAISSTLIEITKNVFDENLKDFEKLKLIFNYIRKLHYIITYKIILIK
jgi:hypothetical protein